MSTHSDKEMAESLARRVDKIVAITDPETVELSEAALLALPTQADTLAWVAARWPWSVKPEWRAIKVSEEAGEVAGALIKYREGRKTQADVAQETAQLVICAMAFAESVGFDLQAAIAAEWALIGTRTWGTEQGASDV